jgi:hypothetical protein
MDMFLSSGRGRRAACSSLFPTKRATCILVVFPSEGHMMKKSRKQAILRVECHSENDLEQTSIKGKVLIPVTEKGQRLNPR